MNALQLRMLAWTLCDLFCNVDVAAMLHEGGLLRRLCRFCNLDVATPVQRTLVRLFRCQLTHNAEQSMSCSTCWPVEWITA